MTPWYHELLVDVYQCHVLDVLAVLQPQSCQLAITSPPYFGLRAYAVEPQVWGGVAGCQHLWGDEEHVSQSTQGWSDKSGLKRDGRPEASRLHTILTSPKRATQPRDVSRGQWCQACGAWLGHLGLEPLPWCEASLQGRDCTDHCYLSHLLQVCDGIYRVLRDDGCFVLNCGDSYAGSSQTGGLASSSGLSKWKNGGRREMRDVHAPKRAVPEGMKPKNLMNLPARLSTAMQSRGWILRSAMPWVKRSAMPSSQDDRPTVSHEMLYLFAKQASYFWGPDAIRMPAMGQNTHDLTGQGYRAPGQTPQIGNRKPLHSTTYSRHRSSVPGGQDLRAEPSSGRTRRTGDWFYESLDAVIADTEAWLAHAKSVRDHGGLLLSPEGEPLGLNVNPQARKELHFASFPDALVRPFVLAATSQYGACSTCHTPWTRIVSRSSITPVDYEGKWAEADPQANGRRILANVRARRQSGEAHDTPFPSATTLAWFPTCACGGDHLIPMPYGPTPTHPEYWAARQAQVEDEWPDVDPCTILEPFGGRGTVASVARALGRKTEIIELSDDYCELIKDTLNADLPLFAEEPVSPHGHHSTQEALNFDA